MTIKPSLQLHAKVGGFFHIEKRKANSGLLTGQWDFHNNITDTGLDLMANAGTFAYGIGYYENACTVGSGNTAPTDLDTVLTSPIATTNATDGGDGSGTNSYVAGPPAYWKHVRTYQFGTGVAAGNVAEIGIYCSQVGVNRLFCRELVRDGSGNPTVIVVQADEILIVTYELRFYLDLSDFAGVISIGGVNYNYTQRVMDVDNVPTVNRLLKQNSDGNTAQVSAFSGDAGTTTNRPAGTEVFKTVAFSAYTTGNYYVDITSTFGVNDANFGAGIKALAVQGPFHKFQLSFAANPIMKVSGQQMTVRFRLSWGRYAP